MFGSITTGEILLLLVVAAIVIGPERLPTYAEQLGRLVREVKRMATGATERVREELGEEYKDFDLSDLDPRKYDPRRIIRDALGDEVFSLSPTPKPKPKPKAAGASNGTATATRTRPHRTPPYDDEAT
ncbi:twin-arginine translocation protein, TatB subunit [Beutenbergia cavernae DSM 12333]|uniref:Twin-arginine translocation protein, TatB subunit n=1 Tax=Beutenbergia cavernae (strain ATCC BAA-8 / DSM 12333 / CCUG 43141 / JCM 11478 / NBRC 16432 / NCIMB 13614 / HKI 0122) TaxID=471853 RepID=C5BZ48_BEUC1|nr:sec-independent translocase [Beutenbergia cavernae]ACQ81163.1 twin-arginine translocation protein, TatB subunit [Beutenbergia cavernae DSM 12333]